MSAGGVLGAMCFPSFPSFSGRLFLADQDRELSAAVVRAYNDWHIDEWCGLYPERHIPMIIPMLWDPEASAAEVRRASAEKGCHSLTFTENPAVPRSAELPQRSLGPAVEGARRHRDRPQHPPRLVGQAGHHRTRRADGRDDHAAAHEHLHGGRRPRVVACVQGVPHPAGGPVRGRHRLDPVLPRPARPHLRHAPRLDRAGLRRPAAERRVPPAHPHLLHLRPRGARPHRGDRGRQRVLGAGLPALRFLVAHGTRRSSTPRPPAWGSATPT